MPKQVVSEMKRVFDVKRINYPVQMKLAKNLLNKYKHNEISFALQYVKDSGKDIYSLGYLTDKTMREAIKAMNIEEKEDDGNSGERNKRRIENKQLIYKTKYREDYPLSLFAE